jgi:hypothetical protein
MRVNDELRVEILDEYRLAGCSKPVGGNPKVCELDAEYEIHRRRRGYSPLAGRQPAWQ